MTDRALHSSADRERYYRGDFRYLRRAKMRPKKERDRSDPLLGLG
jgi:hypothetical protein